MNAITCQWSACDHPAFPGGAVDVEFKDKKLTFYLCDIHYQSMQIIEDPKSMIILFVRKGFVRGVDPNFFEEAP